jgi:hypothetical protein
MSTDVVYGTNSLEAVGERARKVAATRARFPNFIICKWNQKENESALGG